MSLRLTPTVLRASIVCWCGVESAVSQHSKAARPQLIASPVSGKICYAIRFTLAWLAQPQQQQPLEAYCRATATSLPVTRQVAWGPRCTAAAQHSSAPQFVAAVQQHLLASHTNIRICWGKQFLENSPP